MKKILFKIPSKEDENLFLMIISKEYKIDYELLDILKKKFGENFYLLINILAGTNFKFPTVDNLDDVSLMIKIYKEIKKMLDYEMDFERIVKITSDKFKITTNKVFSYYNEVLHIIGQK